MMRQMDLVNEGYRFTRNWFRARNLPTFREYVHPMWAGKPITYLEVGVFEGQSICWMLERVLIHAGSRAVGVDPWLMTTKLSGTEMEEVMRRAYYNIRIASPSDRGALVRGSSVEVLRRMASKAGYMGIKPRNVDLMLVDGDHNRLGAYDDGRIALQLVRPGGWIMFDDVENDRPKADHVKDAVSMLTSEFSDSMKLIWKHGYMECFEVLK